MPRIFDLLVVWPDHATVVPAGHVPVGAMTLVMVTCSTATLRRIGASSKAWFPPPREVDAMYSMQHVLWRGAMALSLLVVGGLGAYTAPVVERPEIACTDTQVVAKRVVPGTAVAYRQVQFDTIVVRGIPSLPEDA
jgi:hypothetical protein